MSYIKSLCLWQFWEPYSMPCIRSLCLCWDCMANRQADWQTDIQLQYHLWGFWVWITLWGSHRYKGTCKVLNGPYLWGLLVGGSLIVRFHTHLWSICLSLSVFVKYFDCKYNMFLKICIDFIVINSLPFGHNDLGPRRSMSR